MVTSTFELFKIGVGPSSSHTMGPMNAACDFVTELSQTPFRIEVALYGSLALTGRGHATDRAVVMGLSGYRPHSVDPDIIGPVLETVERLSVLVLPDGTSMAFVPARDILWLCSERLDFHSNALRFTAFDQAGNVILTRLYFSVGGGTIVGEHDVRTNAPPSVLEDVPYPYRSGAELLKMAEHVGSIAAVQRANELACMNTTELSRRLGVIVAAMDACIDRGLITDGELPGGLRVQRRAAPGHRKLLSRQEQMLADPLSVIDWVNLWALAVNEENAAGGRVVTAPTNGAAGIVPAVLRYYRRMVPGACAEKVEDFLLTAAAIGSLFKENASISGAEVGCQGEVGVACSMAAAGLTAVMGGTAAQVENAAEIGMEHNLGLTCDPVGGLVQVPCIERNAVGSMKAIEAARLALLGNGAHRVSLDEVVETMRRTGFDMGAKYKETAQGGLATNVVAC